MGFITRPFSCRVVVPVQVSTRTCTPVLPNYDANQIMLLPMSHIQPLSLHGTFRSSSWTKDLRRWVNTVHFTCKERYKKGLLWAGRGTTPVSELAWPQSSPKPEPGGWLGSWRWSGDQGKPGLVTLSFCWPQKADDEMIDWSNQAFVLNTLLSIGFLLKTPGQTCAHCVFSCLLPSWNC